MVEGDYENLKYSLGLKQGETMSPVLVSLFLNDLELFLRQDTASALNIDDITLTLPLLANDMAVLGNSPDDLQRSLDLLFTYCSTWGLEVNESKTKVMVFRKGGNVLPTEKWTYNNTNVEVVDSSNYLSTAFKYNGSFALLNILLYNCKRYPLKPITRCQLFDAFIGSILNYSAESWGFSLKSKSLENNHTKFCKRILKKFD